MRVTKTLSSLVALFVVSSASAQDSVDTLLDKLATAQKQKIEVAKQINELTGEIQTRLLALNKRLAEINGAPFHLERYLDEEVFRFNERAGSDWARFWTTLKGVLGRRLTYRELCAIDGAGFMGLT